MSGFHSRRLTRKLADRIRILVAFLVTLFAGQQWSVFERRPEFAQPRFGAGALVKIAILRFHGEFQLLDGAMQIAGPTFVSTLTICIVFVSVLFLNGPAQYLFTPLALARPA